MNYLYYEVLFVDLSPHAVTDEIQYGCHSSNLGDFYMQISAAIIEKKNVIQYYRK